MRYLWIMLALITISAQAAIYKWVDKDGKVHFSDQPHPNAEIVELNEKTQNSVALPPAKPLNLGNTSVKTEQEATQYQVQITSPEHDATIRSNPGEMVVSVAVSPNLASGHYLQVYIDGVATTEAQASPVFQLHGIERGQHQIEAKVIQQNGKVLASSSAITIYMHQAGLIKPAFAAPSVKK
ncbi:DUF4124 domain-containing protein [Shewanella avicenniae]|uniref:DUF4124 domain-containing protein n=1 Tax=Shewanella avicenniae TaxID=2814294 RepID=A0ABX7QR04_9GAMM|nr:DUF4124 domain-containing protein [Shewanella avicenniae]QSX33899.1 DUF4124 domain-containing protein [Shewanella avicenniae]